MGYIYKITNIINNKIYIGQTTKTITERFQKHINTMMYGTKTYLYNAMRKYGTSNFIIEKIEEIPNEKLDEREQYWIKYYNSYDPNQGYNMTLGGNAGKDTWTHSPDKFTRREHLRKGHLKENYIPINKNEFEKDLLSGLTTKELLNKYKGGIKTLEQQCKELFGCSIGEYRKKHNISARKERVIIEPKIIWELCHKYSPKEAERQSGLSHMTWYRKCNKYFGATPSIIATWEEEDFNVKLK